MAGSTVPLTSDSRKKGSLSCRCFWPPRESVLGHRRETAQRQRAHPRGAHSPPSRLAGGATAAVASCHRRSLSLACAWFSTGNECLRVYKGARPTDNFVHPKVTRYRWSKMDGTRRFRFDLAQVGGQNVGPGLLLRVWFPSGLGRTKTGLLSWF
jgi:hypothetical protein